MTDTAHPSTASDPRPRPQDPGYLDLNRRKARYGVSYVRNVCAQAGAGFQETGPDEDVLAVDCDVKFREGSVGVQVKCTSTLTIGGRSASWPIDPAWVPRWNDAIFPVYFVLVIVPPASEGWLTHHTTGTMHNTAAFWCRILPETVTNRINIPKQQRLRAATLADWHDEMLASVGVAS